MNITEFAAVPAIVVIVYLFAYFLKTLITSETLSRLIPPICGTLGCALGLVCWFTLPGYIPAENWLVAAAIGIVSGLASTGANQIYKQATKGAGSNA